MNKCSYVIQPLHMKGRSVMKKTWRIDIDCPNCAAKIEKEVGELEGVREVTLNLMKETLTVQLDADSAAAIAKQIETVVHSHEPEVAVSVCNAGAKASPKGAEAHDQDGRKTVFFYRLQRSKRIMRLILRKL